MDKQIEQKIEWCYKRRYRTAEIAEATGESPKKIKEFLQKQDYFIANWSGGLHGNLFYFEKIDTEEKAYWLGFIFADGYVNKNGALGIELHEKDKGHIEKFKEAIEGEANVKIYNKNSTFGPQTTARFVITSKHTFIPHLTKHYKSLDKTYKGELPSLEEPLMRHCIRGFFDGDGTLTGKPKKEGDLWHPSISFCGRKNVLSKIEAIAGFDWNWSQRYPEKDVDNYSIAIGRVNDSLAFLDYMYEGASVYLDRKHELYLDLKRNREKYRAKARV